MALGDLKGGKFDLVYRKKASAYTSPAAGDVVAFDSSGDMIAATSTTYGKHGVLTALTHEVSGTTYYGICMRGKIVCKAGGTIQPNLPVVPDDNADAIEATTTVSGTFDNSQVQMLWRVFGVYLRKDGDNQYAASDAASTNEIIVDVGGWP